DAPTIRLRDRPRLRSRRRQVEGRDLVGDARAAVPLRRASATGCGHKREGAHAAAARAGGGWPGRAAREAGGASARRVLAHRLGPLAQRSARPAGRLGRALRTGVVYAHPLAGL
ncbi:MAG: Transcriptional regulator, HxlR family, partial [uncultured Ramlibacter sp.]